MRLPDLLRLRRAVTDGTQGFVGNVGNPLSGHFGRVLNLNLPVTGHWSRPVRSGGFVRILQLDDS